MFGLTGALGGDVTRPQVALRTSRRLDQVDTARLLDRIAALREEVGRVTLQLGRETVPATSLGALASALDHTARLVTGEGGSRRSRDAGPAVAARRCA